MRGSKTPELRALTRHVVHIQSEPIEISMQWSRLVAVIAFEVECENTWKDITRHYLWQWDGGTDNNEL